MLQRWLLVWLVLSAVPATVEAQTPATPPQPSTSPGAAARLRVFLECDCFEEYLRDEISWVDFVRQAQDADVHLLSSERETGGGGEELVLRFVGRGRFTDASHELRVVSQVGETELVRRSQVLQTVIVGLLHFMARESLPADIKLEVEAAAAPAATGAPARDPWNLWFFSVSTGASFDAEETSRESEWNVDFTADRVTEQWKLAMGLSVEEQREQFDLDEDDALDVRRSERSGRWFVARGLGPHWSFGVDGEIASSTFGNTEFFAHTAPAVEYSVFPYRDYATRQFVLQYQVGVEHARYHEVTLFNQLQETHGRQALSADFDVQQPWGSIETGVEWSQYLHDLSKYRVEVDGEISLRIVRGLEIEIEGFASRMRDQLSLPRRGATPEEVLLRLRELQSGYEVRFSFGISYSFGSLFNNVVNPRFGNRGRNDNGGQ
jgi:hypothetical protein